MAAVNGSSFVTIDGQRYVCIRDVDRLEPFLISVVNGGEGWLFAGSNSALTAGRVDPDGAHLPVPDRRQAAAPSGRKRRPECLPRAS